LLVRRLKRLPRTWIAYAFLAKWQIRKALWSFQVFWLAQNCQRSAKYQKRLRKDKFFN